MSNFAYLNSIMQLYPGDFRSHVFFMTVITYDIVSFLGGFSHSMVLIIDVNLEYFQTKNNNAPP